MNRIKRIALVMVIAFVGLTMVFAQGAAEALEAQKDIVVLIQTMFIVPSTTISAMLDLPPTRLRWKKTTLLFL